MTVMATVGATSNTASGKWENCCMVGEHVCTNFVSEVTAGAEEPTFFFLSSMMNNVNIQG
jgi:hypothetical protein